MTTDLMQIAIAELAKATAANGGSVPPEYGKSTAERAVLDAAHALDLITFKNGLLADSTPAVLTDKGWDAARKWLAEEPASWRAHLASRVRTA